MREQQFAHCVLMGVIALLAIPINAQAQGIPSTDALSYGGVAYDNNGPAAPLRTVDVTLLRTNGSVACMGSGTTAAGGRFSVPLPSSCVAAVESDNGIRVEVRLDNVLLGAGAVSAAPYAVEAKNAQAAVNATNATNASNATGSLAAELSSLAARLNAVENLTFAQANGSNQQTVANVPSQTFSNAPLSGRTLGFTKTQANTRVQVIVKNVVRLSKGSGGTHTETTVRARIGGQTCGEARARVGFLQGGQADFPMVSVGSCSGLAAGTHTVTLEASGQISDQGGQATYFEWDIQVTELP